MSGELWQKISTDVLINTFFKLSLKVRGLVFIPLFTIGLSVADYGAQVQALGILIIAANISCLGLDMGLVSYIQEYDQDEAVIVNTVLAICLPVSIGTGLVIAAISPLLSEYTLQTGRYTLLFVAVAVYLPFEMLFRIGRAWFQAHQRLQVHGGLEALDVWLSVGSAVIAIFVLDVTIIGAFIAIILARCLSSFIAIAPVFSTVGFAKPRFSDAKRYLVFSVPAMGSGLAKHALDKTDRLLIGFFLGASAVGTYSVAYSVAYVLLILSAPLSASFYGEFTSLWEKGDRETIRRYTTSGVRYLTTLSVPAIAGLYFVGEDILSLLSTPAVATAAVLPLTLIGVSMYFRGVIELYQYLFYAASDSRTPLSVQLAMVAINVILNLAVIPYWGIVGAAATTVVSFSFGAILIHRQFSETLSITLPIKKIGRVLIATICMAAVLFVISINWLAIILVGIAVYFITLIAIGGISRREIQMIGDGLIG